MEWWYLWWLIFPLMGMAGGAAKAWERGARRRHERRLEIIRAKGQLSAESRPAATSAETPDPRSGSQQAQLERLFAAHDDVTRRWLDYELDVSKLIAYPAMSDGRQPLTAAFLRAKRAADNLRPESSKTRLTREALTEYRDAVTDYEVAFDVAERDARRVKDTAFSDAERKRLETAKRLLTVAVDQAATPAERQLAYRRVREELDGLLLLSDEAIDVLEHKVSLELLPGPADAAHAGDAGPVASVSADGADAAGHDVPRAPAPRPEGSAERGGPPADAPRSAPEPLPRTTPARAPETRPPGRVVRPKSS